MKRLLLTSVLMALCGSAQAFADPMFQFTLTGDGHTFVFALPNPPTVTAAPHEIFAGIGSAAGTVDGVAGFTFSGYSVAELNTGTSPELVLSVTPNPSGITTPFPMSNGLYDLFGPTITTLVSDVPNPNPICYPTGVCNDLLTFAYVPNTYSFMGTDPDLRLGSYTLDISAAGSTGVAPEPPSFLLCAAGLVAVAYLRRRSLAGKVRLPH